MNLIKTRLVPSDFGTSNSTISATVTAIISNISKHPSNSGDKTYIEFIYYDDVLEECCNGPLRLGTNPKQSFILIPTFRLFGYNVANNLTESEIVDIETDLFNKRNEFIGCAVLLPVTLDDDRKFKTAQAPKEIPENHDPKIDNEIHRLEDWIFDNRPSR